MYPKLPREGEPGHANPLDASPAAFLAEYLMRLSDIDGNLAAVLVFLSSSIVTEEENDMRWKKLATAAILGASLIAGSALPAMARDRDDHCEKRVHKAEMKLHDAERKHGEHSRQAEKRREELERERANCRMNHDRH
ncbi:MAG TPA: hypothetical protein VF786_09700 [Terriglobales bacterium]